MRAPAPGPGVCTKMSAIASVRAHAGRTQKRDVIERGIPTM